VNARADEALVRGRVGRVFAFLDRLIVDLPAPAGLGESLWTHIRSAGEEAGAFPRMSAVQVPLLVHAASTGDESPALPVAAACTAWHLGVGLQDNFLDQELPSFWRPRGPAEASLVATVLAGSIPQLCVARLEQEGASPDTLWALARLFADTLLTVTAGQHEDMLFEDREDVSLGDCQAMVEHKSGSAGALLARAGATLATGDSSRIEAYAAFGSCYGVARQLINDVYGIWGEPVSRDLSNGKRTFPVVHALTVLDGDRRERLLELLAARRSAEGHDEVRALLGAAGSVRYTDSIVWLYRERARKHLAAAAPRGPAGRELEMLLDRAYILPRAGEIRTPARG
jgi:geranylgeranyl diphosphate synthase type I